MGGDFLLGRQGVGRRADQDRVGLDGLGRLGIGDRLLGTDGAGTYHQGQAAIDHVLGLRGEVEALLGGMGVVLTGRTADDDAVNPGFDQVFQHLREGRFIDGSLCGQGSDCRGEDTVKVHFGFSLGEGLVYSPRRYVVQWLGMFGFQASDAACCRLSERVSGARAQATSKPMKVTTAAATMVCAMPRVSSETGTR
ncbi:hypothetical protein D3C84_452430 [compost metagenome]